MPRRTLRLAGVIDGSTLRTSFSALGHLLLHRLQGQQYKSLLRIGSDN